MRKKAEWAACRDKNGEKSGLAESEKIKGPPPPSGGAPYKKGVTYCSNPFKYPGGEGEIRTPGGVTHTRFPIVLRKSA